MEAKDTVMNDKQLYELGAEDWRDIRWLTKVAQAQAEISFKAGTKEVAEWVEKHQKQDIFGNIFPNPYGFEWRSKLKKWGIEQE